MGKMDKVDLTEPGAVLDLAVRAWVVGLGRGRVGKSTVLRLLAERARNAGREVIVADGDARNPTLSALFADARKPRSGDPAEVRDWLTGLLNDVAEQPRSLVLDLGGGDRALEEYGRDLALVEFCEAVGITPVAVHVIGPDLDDLRHVVNIERAGHFKPERTMVVLNEALVRQGASTMGAFDPILATPEFGELAGRGVKVVLLRRLPCLADVDRSGLGLFAAAEGKPGRDGRPLGPVQRHMLKGWLRNTEAEFGEWVKWLP